MRLLVKSGLGKLLGQEITLINLSPLRLPPSIAAFITDWLPWIKFVVGLCLLAGIVTQPMAVVACGLGAAFIVFNSWMIANMSFNVTGLHKCQDY